MENVVFSLALAGSTVVLLVFAVWSDIAILSVLSQLLHNLYDLGYNFQSKFLIPQRLRSKYVQFGRMMKERSMEMKTGVNEGSPAFQLTILREEDAEASRKEFKEHVVAGLMKPRKALSSMYFYDDRGSELYAKITELDEYYLTRTEKEIFETYANDIVKAHFSSRDLDDASETINVVELGAGDGRKTKILLSALLANGIDFEYIPIDISRRAMANLFESMGTYFKNEPLRVHGIIGEYLESVQHVVSAHPSRRTAVLFIGASIGNFSVDSAVSFLKELRAKLHPQDFLLLGTDLRKDAETMRKAYSDSKGVTKEFNLNLLTRINRELGGNFDTGSFEHLAIYNPNIGAMESYLLAAKSQRVSLKWGNELGTTSKNKGNTSAAVEFSFSEFEPLYLECSYKYTIEIVAEMLQSAGYLVAAKYLDKRRWFMDSVSVVPNI